VLVIITNVQRTSLSANSVTPQTNLSVITKHSRLPFPVFESEGVYMGGDKDHRSTPKLKEQKTRNKGSCEG
jgi:hypothetical protein